MKSTVQLNHTGSEPIGRCCAFSSNAGADDAGAFSYWLAKLTEVPSLELPRREQKLSDGSTCANTFFAVDRGTLSKLQNLAGTEGVGLPIVLLAGLAVLLQRYTGHDQILLTA